MANPSFNRRLFSIRGLRSFFQNYQLQFARPLLGAQLRQQVYGFVPGPTHEKEQAYQRIKAAFRAGLDLTEAPADEALLIRSIPIYGTAGNPPGVIPRRIVYQTRSTVNINCPNKPSHSIVRSITVQDDSSLTTQELSSAIENNIRNRFGTNDKYPSLTSGCTVSVSNLKIEWVIRRD